MPQAISNSAARYKARNRGLRRPFFESLDARMVLSACGPDCDLSDGHLHVPASAAPVAQIVVSQPVVATSGHQHFTPQLSTSPSEKSHSLESLSEGESTAIANSLEVIPPAAIAAAAAEHNAHSSSTDWLPIQSGHIEHTFIYTHIHAAFTPASPGAFHNHASRYFTSAAVAVDSSATLHDEASAPLALQTSIAPPEHASHVPTAAKVEPASKLVPKRCTVTTSGGVLVTSVDGKRQCDCDGKAQAAQQIKQQLTGDQSAGGQSSFLAALADCQPCQRSALLAGLAADFVVCNLTPEDAGQQPLSGLPLPILQQLHGESCPEKSAYDASQELAAADAQLLHGLQILGLATLATSVALLPTLRLRPDQRRRDDEFQPAADLLFGRLNVELLT